MKETNVVDYNTIAAYNANRIREEIKVAMGSMGSDSVVLLLTTQINYQNVVPELMTHMTEKASGVYVAINKPSLAIKKILEKEVDLSRVIFVDAITQTINGNGKSDDIYVAVKQGLKKVEGAHIKKLNGCRYVASPENLTDLCEAITDSVQTISGSKFVFFDSLSTLLLYNDVTTVARFAHFLTGKIRSWGAGGILLSLENSSDALTVQLSQFCDAVIKIGAD